MKKVLFVFVVFMFSYMLAGAQMVQGTIVDPVPGDNTVAVYAKVSSPGLTNVLFLNINITISIPDQSALGGNPTDAQITAVSKIANLGITPAVGGAYTANPYVSGGRAYYSYIMNDNSNGTTSTWLANSGNNPVAQFTFPSGSYISGAQLNDLSPNGGPNQQMYWYVTIISGSGGDITNYTNMFYGSLSSPPTNNASASPSFVGIQPLSVLPVKFVNFTVSKNNNTAVLNWLVENEDFNVKNYIVQKSTNGADFTNLASIAALNNGRSNNSYAYTVDKLSDIPNSGVIYFRIIQTNKDGNTVFTEIKNVRLSDGGIVLGIYPNPIKSSANLSFELMQSEKVSLTVVDALGKSVRSLQFQGFKGTNTKVLDMSNLASGNYTLKLQTISDVKAVPLVKVN